MAGIIVINDGVSLIIDKKKTHVTVLRQCKTSFETSRRFIFHLTCEENHETGRERDSKVFKRAIMTRYWENGDELYRIVVTRFNEESLAAIRGKRKKITDVQEMEYIFVCIP